MIAAEAESHRLLAILAADGVGYSLLVSRDEQAALVALDAARAAFRSAVSAEGGRVVDTAGDSVLAVFGTASGALRAALRVQHEANGGGAGEGRLRFRIGLHLGDVLEKPDGTVYGEGVNVAARLQAIAAPDGIVVSQALRSSVSGRLDVRFGDIGAQRLKNIAEPMRAFRVEPAAAPATRRRRWPAVGVAAALALLASIVVAVALRGAAPPSRPATVPSGAPSAGLIGQSVAVLVFESAGADSANDRFAEGVSDELTTMLSRVPGMKIAARSSAGYFKGRDVPLADIARQLGVRYLVTGRGRQSGERVRLDVQLVDAPSGTSVWARSYERRIEDIFAIQTEIATSVLNNLRVKISQVELVGTGTTHPEARRLFLQAQQVQAENPLTNVVEPLLRAALKHDPDFVRARLMLIDVQVLAGRFSFGSRNGAELRALLDEATAIATKTPDLFESNATLALVDNAAWRFDDAARAEARALRVGAGHVESLVLRSRSAARDGRLSDAVASMEAGLELDPLAADAMAEGARLMAMAGLDERALALADRSLDLSPGARYTTALKAMVLNRLGRSDAARAALQSIEGGPLTTFFGVAALAALGDRETLKQHLLLIERTEPHSFFHVYLLLHLGEHERALDALRADNLTSADFFLRTQYDPVWDPVRRTERFRQLLSTLGVEGQHDRAQVWRDTRSGTSPLGAGPGAPATGRGVPSARAASS